MVCAEASAAPLARASSASAGANTGTDSASSSCGRIDSKPPAEPTTTSASGCQSALVNTVLNQLIKLSSESMAWLNAVWTAPSNVLTTIERDHDVRFDDADRGGLVADDGGHAAGQCLGGLRKPDRDDVVEARLRQRPHQRRCLGVGVLAPGHPDGMQAPAAVGGKGFGSEHGGGGLFRRRKRAVVDVECVAIHRGAVGVLTLDENQADGRRSHRQAEHRVHMYPFGATRGPATRRREHPNGTKRRRRGVVRIHLSGRHYLAIDRRARRAAHRGDGAAKVAGRS